MATPVGLLLAGAMSLVASAPAQTRTLIYDPSDPRAFATLQAALDAAAPGDTIQFRRMWGSDEDAVIRKSVTIESVVPGPDVEMGYRAGFVIEALTPGIPLVLRDLEFTRMPTSGMGPCVVTRNRQTGGRVAGEVVMEDISLDWRLPSSTCCGPELDLTVDRLTLRRCRVVLGDTADEYGYCYIWQRKHGIGCLRFTGTLLVLEDSVLRGGSACVLHYREDPMFPDMCPDGGEGGAAILAANAVVLATRVRLSDGNGGSIAADPRWPRTPVPGRATRSRFATLIAHDVLHELGRDDAGGVGGSRGPILRLGSPNSPVTFPLDAVTAEGTAGYPGLLAAPRARTQTLMTAAGFSANTPGNVTALSWRRDRGTQVYSARRVDLAIRLGTPTTNPYGMSSTFAQNHSAPLQQTFRGFVDVPEAQPELTGPAPFIVRVPLSTPWAWSGGDALLEVEVFANSVSGFGGWEVDMQARQRGVGTVAPLGTGCSSSWGAPLLDAPDPRDLIPGGKIDQRLRMALPGAIAAAWFGNRTDEWSGVPLPFTFPNSACTIYANNMVGVLLPVFGDGATALLSVPLPADPIVNGLTVYSQWGVLEPFAYPPITTTRALALTAAAAPSVWFDTIANLDGSAMGVRSPDSYATPVVQLEVR